MRIAIDVVLVAGGLLLVISGCALVANSEKRNERVGGLSLTLYSLAAIIRVWLG